MASDNNDRNFHFSHITSAYTFQNFSKHYLEAFIHIKFSQGKQTSNNYFRT